MIRTLKILLILAVIVGVGVAGYVLFGPARAPQAPDYQAFAVGRETMLGKVTATGSILAKKQINLNFNGAGRVTELLVESGQTVEKGQVLARLDTAELQLALDRAQAALQISQTQLDQVKAGPTAGEVAAAEANVASAQAAYEKAAAGPSAEDIATVRANLASADAGLRKLKNGPTDQEVTVAKANLEQAQITLQQAQAEYDKVSYLGNIGQLPQSRALQQATASFQAAQANYDMATQGANDSQLKAAEAQVVSAQSALERLLKSPTQSELAVAQAQVVQAQSNRDRLKDTPNARDLAISGQQVRQAEIAVEQAQLALDNATLVAPFKGVVAEVNVEENALVGASALSPAFLFLDLSEYHVDVNVDESDVSQVAAGQEAALTLDALPGVTIPAHVDKVSPSSVLSQGVVSYIVTVSINGSDSRLRAGMTANVDIVTAKHPDALTVPNRALRVERDTGRTYVEHLVAGKPVEVDVKVGLRGDQRTEITEGLSDGDQVIVRGISSLDRLRQSIQASGGN